MSAGNLESVRDSFRRWERGDFGEIESRWHEDARITAPEGWPEPGPFEGRDAVVEQLKRLAAGFEQNKAEITSAEEIGDWVIVEYEWSGRGAGSGLEQRMRMAVAFRIEGGRYFEGHYRWDSRRGARGRGDPVRERLASPPAGRASAPS